MTILNNEPHRPAGFEAPAAWRERGLPLNVTPLADRFERHFADGSDRPSGYIFWDCETTGLSPQFDQILQLAAIRTDGDFNIVDELEDVLNIRCDLADGIVPSPTALLTTRVWPEQLLNQGMTSPEMIDRIAETFDRWRLPRLLDDLETKRADGAAASIVTGPTVFLGWNSIRFDEEILRHSLFKALHAPYLTQSAGSLRADVMVMAQAAHLLHPGSIVVPESIDPKTGAAKLSFRLGDLARTNAITFGEDEAHDALADVRATIAVCRLIKERAPSAFDLMLRNALKQNITATITTNWGGVAGIDPVAPHSVGYTPMRTEPVAKHIMQPYAFCAIYGGKPSVKAVMPIGALPNGGPMLALDLSIDPANYLSLSDDDLRLLVKQKAVWPIVSVRANRQPILLPLELRQDNLPPAFVSLVEAIAPDDGDPASAQAILVNRLERIRRTEVATPGTIARLMAIAAELKPEYPVSEMVEEQLYSGGFPSRGDEGLRERMRAMSPTEFVRHIPALQDPRLREFAARRAYTMFPDLLPEAEQIRLRTLFGDRISGSAEHPWRTAAEASVEIVKLREEHEDGPVETLGHLDAIEAFIDQLFASAAIDAVGGSDTDDLNGLS